jgi:hypothetical protein
MSDIRLLLGRGLQHHSPGLRDGRDRVRNVLVEVSQKSFQTTTLRVCEVGGQSEGAQVGERLVEGFDAALQLNGPWSERG